MTTITQEIRINAPKEHVWAILADLGAVQRFHPGVKKSYYSTTQKEGVGASRVCELLPMGEVVETASAWQEGEYMKIDIVEGKKMPPFKQANGSYRLREENGQTVVKLALNYGLKFGPIGRLMDAVMVRSQFKKVVPNMLAGLKHYAETGEEANPTVLKAVRTPLATATQLQLSVN